MADEPQQTDTDIQQTTIGEPKPEPPHGDEGKQIDWKAESRKWEERSKSNAKAALELEELRQQKAEADKERADLKTKLDDLARKQQINDWRSQVATEKDVPAALLQGATLKEMRESADRLLDWAKPSKNTPVSLGNEPKAGKASDEAAFVRQIFHKQD